MHRYLLAILLLLSANAVYAQALTDNQSTCLDRIRNETDFIISRINLIHRDYETRIKTSGLADYHSGHYSTEKLLDNTIRKYHQQLVRRLRGKSSHYRSQLRSHHADVESECPAGRLQQGSVGTIHEFELSWEQALKKAQRNARYFTELNAIE